MPRAAGLLIATVLLMVPVGAQEVYRPGDGVSLPRATRKVTPQYTTQALRAKISGTVTVEAVVLANGTVGEVTVIRSLDKKYGLDEQAVAAAKQWRFEPGKKDGKAVAVRVTIEHTFKIQK